MVLFVGETCIERCPKSTHSFYNQHPFLISQAKQWFMEQPKSVQQRGTLYVAQREIGIVPGTDSRVRVIGSDDATTCHIVVLAHKESTGVALAHFDGGNSEEHALQQMIDGIITPNGRRTVDVYTIGGFHENSGTVKGVKDSQELSLKLLRLMISLECEFHLMQWFCCELNTRRDKGQNSVRPRFHGLCWDRVGQSAHPAIFGSHGPDATLRSAASWALPSPVMINIYNHNSNSITILPFDCESDSSWRVYCVQPNEWILKHWSTSPTAEPPHFCDQMRKLFHLLAAHPNPKETLFENAKPITYVLDSSGEWKKS